MSEDTTHTGPKQSSHLQSNCWLYCKVLEKKKKTTWKNAGKIHPSAVVNKRCIWVSSKENCSSPLTCDKVCANFCSVLCSHKSISLETLPRYFPGEQTRRYVTWQKDAVQRLGHQSGGYQLQYACPAEVSAKAFNRHNRPTSATTSCPQWKQVLYLDTAENREGSCHNT